MELFNANCFDIFPKIGDKTINLFVLDLPYANFKFGSCTACKWDIPIDLDKMWIEIKRIMKPNAVIVFFCNTKFGYALIDSNPKWFKYDLIWRKSKKVGFLNSNRAPLRQHENIYIFDNTNNDDIELNRYLDLRAYAEKVFKFIGKTKKELMKDIGQKIDHFSRFKSSQFGLPNIETYNELIEKYKINEMEGFIEYDIFKNSWDKETSSTYNPQKTEGKPYKTKGGSISHNSVYATITLAKVINKGERHPSSILPNIELEEHENLYVFDNTNNYDIENEEEKFNLNLDIINYSKKILEYIGKSKKEIIKEAGTGIDHFFRYSRGNFSLPIKKNYQKLTKIYKINEMEGFIEYDILKDSWEQLPPKIHSTYNPQKTEGKPYEIKENDLTNSYYRGGNKEYKSLGNKNKGDRHPTSILPDDLKSTILEYNNPHRTIHRTQKPEKLLEWLIKTYSNEEDTVMDFCMGSGTAGVACKNTNRKFIGVEMDKEIFELAKKRIENHSASVSVSII